MQQLRAKRYKVKFKSRFFLIALAREKSIKFMVALPHSKFFFFFCTAMSMQLLIKKKEKKRLSYTGVIPGDRRAGR